MLVVDYTKKKVRKVVWIVVGNPNTPTLGRHNFRMRAIEQSSCLNQGSNPPPASYTMSARHYYFQILAMVSRITHRLVIEYRLGDLT